mmetsp:Transcript_3803/g.6659  ORF Transcript_3803/g.6659 Transcript_3803/m.6659 type:complete len:211 (+) Transcript_3803:514-1146(+)
MNSSWILFLWWYCIRMRCSHKVFSLHIRRNCWKYSVQLCRRILSTHVNIHCTLSQLNVLFLFCNYLFQVFLFLADRRNFCFSYIHLFILTSFVDFRDVHHFSPNWQLHRTVHKTFSHWWLQQLFQTRLIRRLNFMYTRKSVLILRQVKLNRRSSPAKGMISKPSICRWRRCYSRNDQLRETRRRADPLHYKNPRNRNWVIYGDFRRFRHS